VGPDGTAEHCLLKYAVEASANSAIIAALKGCGKGVDTLVCDTKAGEPSNGEVLCNMLWRLRGAGSDIVVLSEAFAQKKQLSAMRDGPEAPSPPRKGQGNGPGGLVGQR
jgi:hypothetical protein